MPDDIVVLVSLFLNFVFVVLTIWAIVVVIKLPGLLERQASQQSQIQGTLREILGTLRETLAEIRAVTKADS